MRINQLFWAREQSLKSFVSMPEHPESFPVNALVPIPGTPMETNEASARLNS